MLAACLTVTSVYLFVSPSCMMTSCQLAAMTCAVPNTGGCSKIPHLHISALDCLHGSAWIPHISDKWQQITAKLPQITERRLQIDTFNWSAVQRKFTRYIGVFSSMFYSECFEMLRAESLQLRHLKSDCKLKAYTLYWLFGPKNQSFRNKSGKAQPIRTKLGIRGHVKEWQRSGNFGRDRSILGKMGAGTSPVENEFLW